MSLWFESISREVNLFLFFVEGKETGYLKVQSISYSSIRRNFVRDLAYLLWYCSGWNSKSTRVLGNDCRLNGYTSVGRCCFGIVFERLCWLLQRRLFIKQGMDFSAWDFQARIRGACVALDDRCCVQTGWRLAFSV